MLAKTLNQHEYFEPQRNVFKHAYPHSTNFDHGLHARREHVRINYNNNFFLCENKVIKGAFVYKKSRIGAVQFLKKTLIFVV